MLVALDKGAVGYIRKSCSGYEMFPALWIILQGDITFRPVEHRKSQHTPDAVKYPYAKPNDSTRTSPALPAASGDGGACLQSAGRGRQGLNRFRRKGRRASKSSSPYIAVAYNLGRALVLAFFSALYQWLHWMAGSFEGMFDFWRLSVTSHGFGWVEENRAVF